MEQRIGPFIPPVPAAGTDPAYIPGLTSPSPAEADDTAEEKAAEQPPDDAVVQDAPEDADDDAADSAEAAGEADVDEEADEAEEAEEAAEEDGGPVFRVSDRRGSITADRTGVRFTLDDQEAEFDWEEIGAVEVDTPRFGRRFTVTVYTGTNRWFEAEVEAPARSDLKVWTEELDAALDAYFEHSEP
ncbi:hypothetical protein ACFXJ5_13050 [Streptomyces sp. NPDC059373]